MAVNKFFSVLKKNSPQFSVGLIVFYFSFLVFNFISTWDDAVTVKSKIGYSMDSEDVDHSPARHHQSFRIRSSSHSLLRAHIYSTTSFTVKLISVPGRYGSLTREHLSIFFQLSSYWDYSTLFKVFRI